MAVGTEAFAACLCLTLTTGLAARKFADPTLHLLLQAFQVRVGLLEDAANHVRPAHGIAGELLKLAAELLLLSLHLFHEVRRAGTILVLVRLENPFRLHQLEEDRRDAL